MPRHQFGLFPFIQYVIRRRDDIGEVQVRPAGVADSGKRTKVGHGGCSETVEVYRRQRLRGNTPICHNIAGGQRYRSFIHSCHKDLSAMTTTNLSAMTTTTAAPASASTTAAQSS